MSEEIMSCLCQNHKKIELHAPLSRRDMVMGLATGTLVLVSGCATNPETGRQQINLVSDSQLLSLSLSAWNDVKSKTPISKDTRAKARVAEIGSRIAGVSHIQNAEWEYEVFDSPQVNAFVLPGGKVGVYKGLIDLVENDAQLACVVGHETGHVSGRHASERLSRGVLAQAGMAVAQAGASKTALSTGAQRDLMTALGLGIQYGVILPFSRDQELEADILGLRYMRDAGYDPRQSLNLWQKMAAASQNKPPEWLSTHPSEATRISRLSDELRRMGYQV